jgi:hypothetical protein
MGANDDEHDAHARREITPGELRSGADDLFRRGPTEGRYVFLRPGQELVGTVPMDAGVELAVIWSPSPNQGGVGALFMQSVRVGPTGEHISASGTVRIGAGALPAFAGLLADVMEIARERLRTIPRRGANGHGADRGQSSRAGGNPPRPHETNGTGGPAHEPVTTEDPKGGTQ